MIDFKKAILGPEEDRNGRVKLTKVVKGNMWYITDFGDEFPVPISDMGDATFLPEDKASFFMRYMRKYNESLS